MNMRVQPWVGRHCMVLCLLALLANAAHSQTHATTNHVADATVQSTASSDDPNTFRVNVRLVNVFTTVTDSHGATIYDLTKDDFRVFEDGVPQTISVFERQSELPLSVVLGIDTSESTRKDLKLEMASAKKFIRSIVRPLDRLSIFQISENTDQLTGFSSDVKYLERGIDNLHAGAGTSLYDAIFLGSEALLTKKGRKVIVLITDGGDTTSQTDYANALRRAQEAEAIIYSIIIVPVAADAGRNLGGEHALIQLSRDTGGKYYYAESISQLDQAFQQVSDELRTQYLIAYYPSRRFSDSSFRHIQIELASHAPPAATWQVRHRAGYFTAPVH